MQTLNPNWKPTYLTNTVSVVLVSGVFVSVNIVILVMTALPTVDEVPNYYWPVTIVGFMAFGLAYWGVLRLLGVKGPTPGGRMTLASKIGLEVNIYEEGDDNIPEEMRFLMHEAALDGSRRRLQYKVCDPYLPVCAPRFEAVMTSHRSVGQRHNAEKDYAEARSLSSSTLAIEAGHSPSHHSW